MNQPPSLAHLTAILRALDMATSAAYDDVPADAEGAAILDAAQGAALNLRKALPLIHNTLSIYYAMIRDLNAEEFEVYERANRALADENGVDALRALAALGLKPKTIKAREDDVYEVEDVT